MVVFFSITMKALLCRPDFTAFCVFFLQNLVAAVSNIIVLSIFTVVYYTTQQ